MFKIEYFLFIIDDINYWKKTKVLSILLANESVECNRGLKSAAQASNTRPKPA